MHAAQIMNQRHNQSVSLDSLLGTDLIFIQRKLVFTLTENSIGHRFVYVSRISCVDSPTLVQINIWSAF